MSEKEENVGLNATRLECVGGPLDGEVAWCETVLEGTSHWIPDECRRYLFNVYLVNNGKLVYQRMVIS